MQKTVGAFSIADSRGSGALSLNTFAQESCCTLSARAIPLAVDNNFIATSKQHGGNETMSNTNTRRGMHAEEVLLECHSASCIRCEEEIEHVVCLLRGLSGRASHRARVGRVLPHVANLQCFRYSATTRLISCVTSSTITCPTATYMVHLEVEFGLTS